MPPARCAFLSSSLANMSNMPYVVSLSLNAYQGDRAFFPGRRLAGRGEEGRQGIPLAGGCHKLGQEAAPELLVSSVPCSPG